MLGNVVAQQEVVHGVVERHAEFETFPLFRVAFVLVLVVQHDGLAVDVFHRGHDIGRRRRTGTHGHRQWHRGQHVRGFVLAVEGFIPGHRPAGGLDHIHIQTVLGIEAHGLGHDDRGGTGNGNEADLELGLFQRPHGILDRRLDLV